MTHKSPRIIILKYLLKNALKITPKHFKISYIKLLFTITFVGLNELNTKCKEINIDDYCRIAERQRVSSIDLSARQRERESAPGFKKESKSKRGRNVQL